MIRERAKMARVLEGQKLLTGYFGIISIFYLPVYLHLFMLAKYQPGMGHKLFNQSFTDAHLDYFSFLLKFTIFA